MKTVAIKNEYIKNLNSDELSIMLILNYLYSNNEEIVFTGGMIQYLLYGQISGNQRMIKSIDTNINSLIDKGILKLLYKSGNTIKSMTYVIASSSVYIDKDKDIYTYIDFKWIKKVAQANVETLKVLLAIGSSFNNETRVGYMSQEDYCINYNISLSTFIRHEKILEEGDILYIKRNPTINMDGQIKQLNNDYGLVDNVVNVDIVSAEYVGKMMSMFGKKMNNCPINSKSISKKYNDFLKGSYKGDIDKLKLDCEKYNAYYSKFADAKFKDMSIFDGAESFDTCIDDVIEDMMI